MFFFIIIELFPKSIYNIRNCGCKLNYRQNLEFLNFKCHFIRGDLCEFFSLGINKLNSFPALEFYINMYIYTYVHTHIHHKHNTTYKYIQNIHLCN